MLTFFLFCLPFTVSADTAKSTIVMDLDSGRILYEKNANQKRLIASITKIMTAIVAIEEGDLTEKITVGEEVLSMYGTNIYVEVGEKMKLRDLLYGLLLRSGNDASVVIAKAIAGSEEKFVNLMNKKAQEIGMKNTIFKNPHGLDEETENYSTAYDMALLSKYAYKNNYHIQGTTDKTMIFDDVRIPLKDENGNNYNINKFGLEFLKFARSLGLQITRNVANNTIIVTFK